MRTLKKMKRRNFLEIAYAGLISTPSSIYGEEEKGIIRRTNIANLKGFAIQDPSSKQNIRGFIDIPSVWGERLKYSDITNYASSRTAAVGLVRSINRYTGIHASMDKPIYLSSQSLHNYPFIYVGADTAFELTSDETQNFDHYLKNGGFAILESLEWSKWDYNQSEASLKQMMRDTLKKDARFLPIPNSHPLYHCFFDFDDGPPQGTEITTYSIQSPLNSQGVDPKTIKMPKLRPYLEGIFIDDRLVTVYSGKGYGEKWTAFTNNNTQQKMGVNFVVFALTQKGGIAQQYLDRRAAAAG